MSARKKYTLLDRAKGDLTNIELILQNPKDEVLLDIAAYHCQQCIEKTIKYAADITGQKFETRHDLFSIAANLELPEILPIVKPYLTMLDTWIAATRHGESIRSNIGVIKEIYEVCKKVVFLAEAMTPAPVSVKPDIKKLDRPES